MGSSAAVWGRARRRRARCRRAGKDWNRKKRKWSERTWGWCRPDGCAAHSICVIWVSYSSCSLSAHGRVEWRFARSAGASGVPRQVRWLRSTGSELVVTGSSRLAAADIFLRNSATTRPPPGAGSFQRVRPGRGHDPGEASTQVAVASVFAKFRNDPPPGQAPAGGLARAGCAAQVTASGNDGRRSWRTWFCEIAQ